MIDFLILGAGISGLSAGYHLKQVGHEPLILEKEEEVGGLCRSFKIGEFTFDHFIHLSFTRNEYVKHFFNQYVKSIEHVPNPFCYYDGKWIKHPALNNLYPLEVDEKVKILTDFINKEEKNEETYADWLCNCYGEYFSKHFPMIYTRKYWGVEAMELNLDWISNRMYQPTLEEVIRGMITQDTPVTYYAQKMYYPTEGGYFSYIKPLAEGLTIKLDEEVTGIDLKNKMVETINKKQYFYKHLISSLPLPKLVQLTKGVSPSIQEAAKELRYTSGYIVSVGLKNKEIPPYLWMYIYDEAFLPTRVYSPSLKSKMNAPDNCSSIQAEVYFDSHAPIDLAPDEILRRTVDDLVKLKVINKKDILFSDIRFEPYANVTFDHRIQSRRHLIEQYFQDNGVQLIGRFGTWEYLWSDQSFLSGKSVIEKYC